MDTITVPSSVFVNGQWATAHWMVDVVDDSTGEMIITATVLPDGQGAPVVAALRMDMGLARELRAMAGFGGEGLDGSDGADGSDEGPCYDCRTTGERIADLRRELAMQAQLMHGLANRLDALEAWQVAMAQDSVEDDTLFRIYDTVARRERALAAGGA